MSGLFDKLWVERYRPKTIDDFVCSENTRSFLANIQKSQSFPNLLLCGIQGTGKTTLAKMLVGNLVESDSLYINASDDRGIDAIRSRVKAFVETKSITKFKVVILDEADGLTGDAQRALKGITEEFWQSARFIMTANNRNKIIAPIQSRFTEIDISPEPIAVYKRLLNILLAENIEINKETKSYVGNLVKNYFPDIRSCIHSLQSSVSEGKVVVSDSAVMTDAFITELLEKLAQSTHSAREFCIKNENVFGNDYPRLLRAIAEYVYKNDDEPNGDLKVITINNYLYKSSERIDQELNAYCCLVELNSQTTK